MEVAGLDGLQPRARDAGLGEGLQQRQERAFGDVEKRRTRGLARREDRRARDAGRAGHERHAALRDPGLVRRDLFDRLAEDIGMVEADVRDDRDDRRDEVRAVEQPADADFDHGDVDARAREVEKREREQRLVIRGSRELARGRVDRGHHLGE